MDQIFLQCLLTRALLHRKHVQSNGRRHVNFDKIDEVPGACLIKKYLSSMIFLDQCHESEFTYFFAKVLLSFSSSRWVVKSLIVSDAVVPLIVRSK